MHPTRSWSSAVVTPAGACLLLLAGFGSVARAQQATLQGTVRDSASGNGLRGAAIELVDLHVRTLTDDSGRFRLPRVPPGAHRVQVLRLGYARWERNLTIGDPTPPPIDVWMNPAPTELAGITVVGDGIGSLIRIPGSVALVDRAEMERTQPISGNEVLRLVPGVNVQEEESMGFRANIGIRGLDPDRSRAVLVLEDGVPVALGPYGEPEMYYTPPIDRMERVEIVKGSGSILFGPQTVGGVINYVTADPPRQPAGRLRLRGGSGTFGMGHLTYGGVWNGGGFHGGVLRRQAQDIRGLWFDQTDVTGKVAVEVSSATTVSVKLGVYDERSNSTYVGLTDSIFRADPTDYPGSNDMLAIRRYSGSVAYDRRISPGVVKVTAYAYQTRRDWRRQDYAYTPSGSGFVWQNSTGNRNRSFEVLGIEPRLTAANALGVLEGGLRLHYEGALDQHINGATATAGTGLIRDHELRHGYALAGFLHQRVHLGPRLRMTPGLRVEWFRYERNILRTRVRRQVRDGGGQVIGETFLPEDVELENRDELAELIPGLGMSWLPNSRLTVFAGVHRGFAPPRIKDALIYQDVTLPPGQQPGEVVSLQLDAEHSWNVEAGLRGQPAPGVTLEATAFRLDFSNQIVVPSLSAGSVAQATLANQGATRHQGFEAAVGVDWGYLAGLGVSIRTDLNYTLVNAVFSRDRWLQRGADTVNIRGNRLPYAPRHGWALSATVELPRAGSIRLDGTHVGQQYSDNFETRASSANGRTGLIPGHTVWNVAATARIPGTRARVVASVKNVMDEVYIASRRPEGIKPGLLRQLQLGVDWDF